MEVKPRSRRRHPDRVLELQDLAGQIVRKRAEGAPQPEIAELVERYHQLRLEL